MDEQKPEQLQPGQVVAPNSTEQPVAPAVAPVTAPAPAPENPVPAAEATLPSEDPPALPPAKETPALAQALAPSHSEPSWTYSDVPDSAAQPTPDLPEQLTWTAAEFVAHEKGAKWYGLLVLAGVVVAALDFLISKDIFSTVIILIATIMFGAYAGRKPREQQYAVNNQGMWIGNKVYDFQGYKTFSIVDEGHAASVVLMPLKRFTPPLTVYLSPEIEDQVVDFLSAFLPFEQHKADMVDSLMRRIRF